MWHQQLTKEQRVETLNQLGLSTGYAPFAIEKDLVGLYGVTRRFSVKI